MNKAGSGDKATLCALALVLLWGSSTTLSQVTVETSPLLRWHAVPVRSVDFADKHFPDLVPLRSNDGLARPSQAKRFTNRLGIKMIWIPPGEFMMGSDNGSA